MFRSSGSSSGPPSLPQLPRQSLISSSITSSQSPAQSNSAPRANFPSLSPRLKWALILGVPIAAVGLGLAFYFATRRSRTAGTIRDGAGAPKAKPTVPAVNEPPRKKEKAPETALEKAIAIKEQGNKLYKSGNYDKAIESYSAAAEKLLRRSQLLQAVIEKRPLPEAEPLSDGDSPPPSVEAARTEFAKLNIELSTYYQNRAASYDALGDLDAVVKDCTLSLSHQKHYQKAISRRARAHERLAMKLVPRLDEGGCGKTPPATIREALVHLREAFEDLTATCILEAFSSADTLLSCDRVLRLLALLRAQYIIATEQEKGSAAGVRADEDIEFLIARQFSLPSSSTIRSFFTPFEHDPVVLQSRALPNAASLTSSLSEAAQLPAAPMDMSTSFELLGGDSQQVRTLKTAIHKYDRMLRAFADQSFEQAETLCHELLDSLANVDLLQLDRDHAAYIREQRQQQQQQQTPPAPPVESAVGDTADGTNKSSEAVDEPQLRTVLLHISMRFFYLLVCSIP